MRSLAFVRVTCFDMNPQMGMASNVVPNKLSPNVRFVGGVQSHSCDWFRPRSEQFGAIRYRNHAIIIIFFSGRGRRRCSTFFSCSDFGRENSVVVVQSENGSKGSTSSTAANLRPRLEGDSGTRACWLNRACTHSQMLTAHHRLGILSG